MCLKGSNEYGTLSEYLHYEPSKKDLIEYYGKEVEYEVWDYDGDFEEFLTDKYESELTDAIEHGYNNLNDYFEDLKF